MDIELLSAYMSYTEDTFWHMQYKIYVLPSSIELECKLFQIIIP